MIFEPLTPNKKPTTFFALTPSTPQSLPVKPKSAKAKFKPTKPKTTSIREDYPKVRIVKRRKGFAYQVDCRSKGWTIWTCSTRIPHQEGSSG
jgi:hypothetical protein